MLDRGTWRDNEESTTTNGELARISSAVPSGFLDASDGRGELGLGHLAADG